MSYDDIQPEAKSSMPNIYLVDGSGVVIQGSYQKANGTIGTTTGKLSRSLNSDSKVSGR